MSKKQYLLWQNFQERIGYTCANCFLHRLWQARNARMMAYERGTRVQSDRREQNTYLYRQVFDFYYLKFECQSLKWARLGFITDLDCYGAS